MYAKEYLELRIKDALSELGLSWPDKAVVEPPREKHFGDLACNVAMLLAKQAGQQPRELASRIKTVLENRSDQLESIEVAGPGFLNFFFKNAFWQQIILTINKELESFGASHLGQNRRVLIEYVSANPTGPLHIGHGRGAALGDSLARIMRFAGFDVQTEYYVNDAGQQMQTLGESVWIRYQRWCGIEVSLAPNHYQGDYLEDIARDLWENHACALLDEPWERAVSICRDKAVQIILEGIREDLAAFGIEHQSWFSERRLLESSEIQDTLDWLQKQDLAYTQDSALWFRSTAFGDDKDRVLQKSDGSWTYFASDICYHQNKYQRGFETLVNIWGADHHGYAPRMKAAVQALGATEGSLQMILVQLVNLLRGGCQVSMSTRAGEFVTLREVLEEVGVDACRFIFLSRKSDSHLDFDLEEVKKKSMDNPVFYVQYAHARICSVFAKAGEKNLEIDKPLEQLLTFLSTHEDLDLLKQLENFPDVVQAAAKNLSPHLISFYLKDLASLLHRYYTEHSVLGAESVDLVQARLLLLRTVSLVLKNGLKLLGVHAPEKM